MGGGPCGFARDARAGGDECVLYRAGALGSVARAQSAGPGASRGLHSRAHNFLFDVCRNSRAAVRAGMFSCGYRACRTAVRTEKSALFHGLRMNRQAENLRKTLFHAILERSGNIV